MKILKTRKGITQIDTIVVFIIIIMIIVYLFSVATYLVEWFPIQFNFSFSFIFFNYKLSHSRFYLLCARRSWSKNFIYWSISTVIWFSDCQENISPLPLIEKIVFSFKGIWIDIRICTIWQCDWILMTWKTYCWLSNHRLMSHEWVTSDIGMPNHSIYLDASYYVKS